MKRVLVIGGGAWGTTLANIVAEKEAVDLLIKEEPVYQEMQQHHTNKRYFPQPLNLNIHPINQYSDLSHYLLIVLAVPTGAIADVCSELKKHHLSPTTILCNAAKGFLPQTKQRVSEYLKDLFPANPVAALLGPGFAQEIIAKQLTVCNAVSDQEATARRVQEFFSCDYFRVYTSTDLIGAEICAFLKNTIAIAAGIVEGFGGGHNTRAALITRGLKEITDFGLSHGAQLQTFAGICGIGDLTLTCSTSMSRNYKLGLEIGKSDSAALLKDYPYTVEGVNTTNVVFHLKQDLPMPIIESVYRILFTGARPSEELTKLMGRRLRSEFGQ